MSKPRSEFILEGVGGLPTIKMVIDRGEREPVPIYETEPGPRSARLAKWWALHRERNASTLRVRA